MTRNPLLLLVLALIAPSCGTAEHVAPNSLNVQQEEMDPNHSLYRHHDIMLQMKQQPKDVFGLVEAGPEVLERVTAQEPAVEATRPAEARVASTNKAQARPASAKVARAAIPTAQLWRERVFEPQWQNSRLVFDVSGIAPKEGAMRPAVLSEGSLKAPKAMHKPLRKRALTRIGESGEVIRSHRAKGSVI